MAGLPRSNCWTLAEHAGHLSPDGLQHLLTRAVWDTDTVRDDLRGYVVGHLAAGDAVLLVDKTGDLKKGTASVGMQRQYTGTAGRDRELPGRGAPGVRRAGRARVHRPVAVSAAQLDRRTCADAGGRCPDGISFATKPALALP